MKKRKTIFSILVANWLLFINSGFVFAKSDVSPEEGSRQSGELGQIGGEEGFGPWGDLGSKGIGPAAQAFAKIISNIIGVMTISAGIWFIFQFIIGAYSWMAAGSDQQAIQNAQQKITNAVMGLVVVVAAYAIISLLGVILGFDILQPQKLLEFVRP